MAGKCIEWKSMFSSQIPCVLAASNVVVVVKVAVVVDDVVDVVVVVVVDVVVDVVVVVVVVVETNGMQVGGPEMKLLMSIST